MALVVQKYGGSSLTTPKHIQRAAKRISQVKQSGRDVVVVVSAMGRTTDHLLALAQKTVRAPAQRELDMLLTAGERISMALLAMALHEQGVPAISFTGSQSGIVTSGEHTEARIIDIKAHRIREELAKGKVVIIAGFQGVSEQNEITTLGRGGSDTTAVAVAAALGAESCEILTDVDGLFSADPKIIPQAQLLALCTYDEALELARLGAKMHSRSIELAKRFGVNVRIASSQNHLCAGTRLIPKASSRRKTMEKVVIRGIATQDGYHYFRLTLSLERCLEILKTERITLRFFNYASNHVSFICPKEKATLVRELLKRHGADFEETAKVSIVSAVGDGIASTPEVIPQFLEAIREVGAECYLLCSNSLSITAAIPATHQRVLTQKLHEKLVVEEKPAKTIRRFEIKKTKGPQEKILEAP